MRDRSLLSVIEQVVMVLVFALAAAFCLRAFVLADHISRSCEERDCAVLAVQSAAETIKHCGGDLAPAAGSLGGAVENGQLVVRYDADWQHADSAPAFILTAKHIDSGDPLLGCAVVTVCGADGAEVFSLTIYWQEVGENG